MDIVYWALEGREAIFRQEKYRLLFTSIDIYIVQYMASLLVGIILLTVDVQRSECEARLLAVCFFII